MQVRSRWILTLFLALMGPLGLVSQALVSGKIVDERTAAKQARDFARADAIRQQLADEGVLLEDTPQGVRWKRA